MKYQACRKAERVKAPTPDLQEVEGSSPVLRKAGMPGVIL